MIILACTPNLSLSMISIWVPVEPCQRMNGPYYQQRLLYIVHIHLFYNQQEFSFLALCMPAGRTQQTIRDNEKRGESLLAEEIHASGFWNHTAKRFEPGSNSIRFPFATKGVLLNNAVLTRNCPRCCCKLCTTNTIARTSKMTLKIRVMLM